jgi:hypothetical protein
VGEGRATITATAGGLTAEARVAVTMPKKPAGWSFRNHVQPVLAKAGCSTGPCHGALAGKNGFKLSLRGYDDERDHLAITRHALGRRIRPEDPAHSLLLLKPTGAVPHKGGVRFGTDAEAYRVLADWIASGAPGPKADDPRIERIEILPPDAVLAPGDTQPLLVRAHFSDGSARDVTPWTKFTATDAAVAGVDEAGLVTVSGPGEGAVTAWHLSMVAVARITVPFPQVAAAPAFDASPRRNFIDDLVLEKLRALNLPPSPPCDDLEFLRRAHLDTIGVLPTPDEARRFGADAAPDKRDRLIEDLLRRPEFVDYWTYRWSDVLLVSSRKLSVSGMWSYYTWLREKIASDTPWDRLARELLTATGDTMENGAANYFLLHEDPTQTSENVTVAFLGMSINCAKCHNHPMEKWTNDQYYGMASLFARVRTKASPRAGHAVVTAAPEGDVIQPLTGRPQPPRPLDGAAMPEADLRDRRAYAADWLTAPDNPWFARAVANRVWANFMGVGLVSAVDDMRETNPPSNDALLQALARHVVENRYDLKSLMRAVLQSATYQRSSRALPENAADRRFYSRFVPRRIHAEPLLDAISQVMEAPTAFQEFTNLQFARGATYPAGWRALQLPNTNIDSYFLRAFGRPDREKTCECERTAEPSIGQVLHIANGETINAKLKAPGNRIGRLLKAGTPLPAIVEEAYLAALSRPPTDEERTRVVAVLEEAGEPARREAVEDLFWSLLGSREFLFNH